MAMIEGFLIAYACFSAPLMGLGLYGAWKKRKVSPKKVAIKGDNIDELLKILEGSNFTGEIHEVPKTPQETIMVQAHRIIDHMKEQDRIALHWFAHLRDKADLSKRDMDAMLQAAKAIASSVLLIEKELGKPKDAEGSIESFVHNLEYARDKFAHTPSQKKVVEAIISNVKMSYEQRTK